MVKYYTRAADNRKNNGDPSFSNSGLVKKVTLLFLTPTYSDNPHTYFDQDFLQKSPR